MSRRVEGVFVACRCAMLALAFALVAPLSARSEAFDIPAQSLATAIDAFCAATGAEVYYDGSVALDQQSSEVAGDHTRDGALRVLLSETNLVPLRVRTSAYLLINPGDDAGRALASAKSAQDARYRQYFAVVQQGVWHSVCRLSDKAAIPDRMIIRLWIDQAGGVARFESDHGEATRWIADFHASLHNLRLPEAPPHHMPQPVTVALLSAKALTANHCPPTAAVTAGQ